MPKNSRRKKQTRQRAARKGERYTRASRNLTATTQAPPRPPFPILADRWYRADLGDDDNVLHDVQQVQQVVESRGGWVLSSFGGQYVDAHGRAGTTGIMWEFVAAFGGAELDDEEDVELQKPTVSLGGDWIVIETGGNWGGCPAHTAARLEWPWTERGLAKLPEFLALVEEIYGPIDPRPFIDCLADGPCAELAHQR